jgi:hypothetical protein
MSKSIRDRHQKWVAKAIVWLFAEILLTFVGIDDMADYSEFIFERNVDAIACIRAPCLSQFY